MFFEPSTGLLLEAVPIKASDFTSMWPDFGWDRGPLRIQDTGAFPDTDFFRVTKSRSMSILGQLSLTVPT